MTDQKRLTNLHSLGIAREPRGQDRDGRRSCLGVPLVDADGERSGCGSAGIDGGEEWLQESEV